VRIVVPLSAAGEDSEPPRAAAAPRVPDATPPAEEKP
jgi:hypothetical protein